MPAPKSRVNLFLIREKVTGTYWSESTEHGTGWCDYPKQAFSKSELLNALRVMIENGYFQTIEVIHLMLPPEAL